MNINMTQVLALTLVVLGVISGGSAQLTDLVGPLITKSMVAAASLATSIISGWMVVLTGQSNLVKTVQDMPGVEKITVNDQANKTLATLAVDPNQAKIEATPQAAAAVADTAKGA
jgi:hypothetical protein